MPDVTDTLTTVTNYLNLISDDYLYLSYLYCYKEHSYYLYIILLHISGY